MSDEVYSTSVIDELVGGLVNVHVYSLRLFFEDQIAKGKRERSEVVTFAKDMRAASRSSSERVVWTKLAEWIEERPGPDLRVIDGGKNSK